MYLMADNDLESFIRDDFKELLESNLIQDPTVTTWVYFDALNLGTEDIYWGVPDSPLLEKLFYANGASAELSGKFEGSRYFTYSHDQQRIIVDTVLEGEQNSDNSSVLYDFAVHALQDCVQKNRDEFVFAFSSHGGGYAGFGGDMNPNRFRRRLEPRRRLIQDNVQVAGALSQALQDVEGAPAKFDLIGFDSCLMQAMGALDEYQNITKLYLASEAVVPGHGWAYYALNPHNNAQELGEEIIKSFVEETQNFGLQGFIASVLNYQTGGHQSPKTMSIVDTENGFAKFSQAWESLSQELYQIMSINKDAKFHAQLGRARASAVSFMGVLDVGAASSVETKSEVDIGSFLAMFADLCEIDPSTNLYSLVQEAQSAYEAMVVLSSTGQGTPDATGVTVHWPSKYFYRENSFFFEAGSLNETHPWYTKSAPRWNLFLDEYLNGPTPLQSSGSACTCGSDVIFTGDLLIDTVFDTSKGIIIKSKIPTETDVVLVDFGLDITSLIGTDQYSRRQNQRRAAQRERSMSSGASCVGAPLTGTNQDRLIRRFHANKNIRNGFDQRDRNGRQRQKRVLQESDEQEDFLYGYGGSVAVKYGCGDFAALWDGRFFLLEDPDGKWDWVYVDDLGNGAKSIPVLYFPSDIPEDIHSKLAGLALTFEEALEAGAVEGSLSFSIQLCEGSINDNLALCTLDGTGLAEQPRSAGGFVIPVVYVYGVVYGKERDYYLGGFNGTSFAWSDDYNMTVTPMDVDDVLTTYSLSTAIVEVYAADLDFEDNATTPSSSYPSNYTGVSFEFFEAGTSDFGLLGLDVYDECLWDDVEDATKSSAAPSSSVLLWVSLIVGMSGTFFF